MPQGTVEVFLSGGHNLNNLETSGKSEAYATFSCGDLKHQSHTVKGAGGNPSWNQLFTFENPDGISNLNVVIYEQKTDGNEQVGTIVIPLEGLYLHRNIPKTKYDVQLPGGKTGGQVELQLRFLPKIYRGSLMVQLVEGHGLLDADIFDKSDPYAIMICNKQKLKSKTKENAGSNPVWNETFLFTINSDAPVLSVELFDRDRFTADDPLGSTVIPLQTVYSQGFVAPTKYTVHLKNGNPHGEITVGLKFTPKA